MVQAELDEVDDVGGEVVAEQPVHRVVDVAAGSAATSSAPGRETKPRSARGCRAPTAS